MKQNDLDRILEERNRNAMRTFRKYWFYAGKWHHAECAFLLRDDGACNCKNVRKDILSALSEI